MAQTAGRKEELICLRVEVKGIVQGVGFRPFVYNLAEKYGLKGWVNNSGQGVTIELEGPEDTVQEFLREMKSRPPRLAKITGIITTRRPSNGYINFQIIKSNPTGEKGTLISPDMAVCNDCRREIFDPADRHYRYPFTNCTNCGPRFTIIRDVPYDRERTSMSDFLMCHECRHEYQDPGDRRFHAQPNACPNCGPRVTLVDRTGRELTGHWEANFKQLITGGKIIAVKGLGGFHLACNAKCGETIEKLRRRKNRPYKPFAVMCRDLTTVKKYCRVNEQEARRLTSPEAPIVILERREDSCLPGSLAPNTNTLGVMLPYTPLHLLLFDTELEIMVMTSGNASDLPLEKDNRRAMEQLGSIADFFLLHDREIHNGCDDSLVRIIKNQLHFYRRSRGFAPRPILVPDAGSKSAVLGMGGEVKNTFCLLQGNKAFLSQHLGEMTFLEGIDYFLTSLASLQKVTNIQPRTIAYDLHPHYGISALARKLPAKFRISVQHHHAHMAACMAENGLDQEVIGVICDGTGYGTDGCIWGFEILTGDYLGFERKYHLSYLPLPGGENAIKKAWRMGVAYLYQYLGQEGLELAFDLFPQKKSEIILTVKMLGQNFNSPLTSSCGRLFDAVSALLGICLENTYEGQAAVELGELAGAAVKGRYPFVMSDGVINPGPMIEGIVHDLRSGVDSGVIATLFHNTLIAMVIEAATRVGKQTGLDKVVLSGGSFQNKYFFLGVSQRLEDTGFRVYYHRQVPANDGGISPGQAMIAARRQQWGIDPA